MQVGGVMLGAALSLRFCAFVESFLSAKKVAPTVVI